MTNSTNKIFGERLSAIMEYDDIPEGDRARFLMGKCGLSRYMAKLVLSGKEPRNLRHFEYIASGLDVDMVWVAFGETVRFHPRTFRILMRQILHYTNERTDKIMRLFIACKAGHQRATNLVELSSAGKLTAYGAAQLLEM